MLSSIFLPIEFEIASVKASHLNAIVSVTALVTIGYVAASRSNWLPWTTAAKLPAAENTNDAQKTAGPVPTPFSSTLSQASLPAPVTTPVLDPLTDFNYANTAPPQHRPYKPKFFITMGVPRPAAAVINVDGFPGLKANPANELILLDNTYRKRLLLRREILSAYSKIVIGNTSRSVPAVGELYTFLFRTYLPTRYPTHFSLTPSRVMMRNQITSQTVATVPQSAEWALRTLGENLDDDFVILMEDRNAPGIWRVEACCVCFPSGFKMGKNIGQRMEEIHESVPGLQKKVGVSIERFFTKLAPGAGNGVNRYNWGMALNSKLFSPDGSLVPPNGKFTPEQSFLRVERQTIWKLPESGAVVFGIKTYMYSLLDMKKSGDGPGLVEAIEGLTGEMAGYKGKAVWGDKVVEYLRS